MPFLSQTKGKVGGNRVPSVLSRYCTWQLKKRSLESRPEDALVKLVKTVEIVETVEALETVETVGTVETEDYKKSHLPTQ